MEVPNIKPQNGTISEDYNNFESISPMGIHSGEGT